MAAHAPGFIALVDAARRNITETTSAEVNGRLERGERFHLLDVREDGEFAVDRVRGAKHVGRGVLERDIEALIPDKTEEIILYCGGGYRSALAAENLGKMGYSNVKSMDGGMREWRAAGYAIEPGS